MLLYDIQFNSGSQSVGCHPNKGREVSKNGLLQGDLNFAYIFSMLLLLVSACSTGLENSVDC